MEPTHLYQQIVESVRREILNGQLKPGDRLPTVRSMTAEWGCTPGTVQRAYSELARQGVVVSRAGQGTHVVGGVAKAGDLPLRRAALVQRAGDFLLETLTAGYAPEEVEAALRLALDQWRVVLQTPEPGAAGVLRFAGSHDLALSRLAAHFPEIAPRFSLQLGFSGSLHGLMALETGQADLAGCHLWDEESDSYNVPFVRRLLPGRRVALITLAHRRVGLIVAPGNPLQLTGLAGLAQAGLRFVNRQPGSGTRVWLDAMLARGGPVRQAIGGYGYEVATHSEVARAVAEGRADAGLGLESAALVYGLDFVFLVRERYDLVVPEEGMEAPALARLTRWLGTEPARRLIQEQGGYEVEQTGQVEWVA